jgi:hypothetical protein
MEIYRDKPTDVTFKLPLAPDSGQVLYEIKDSSGEQRDFGTATSVTSTQFKFTMPFTLLEFDEEFTVTWNFYIDGQLQTRATQVLVVTPLLTIDDIADIDEDIERLVRKVIETYTGVTFGYSHRAYSVRGRGDKALVLPNRLIDVEHVSYTDYDFDSGWIVTADGWMLESDPDEPVSGYGNVIYAPASGYRRYVFRNDRLYIIRGHWGYAFIPPQVRDAAVMLYNDLSCMDAKYRTKYIKSIYFAGTRMEFRAEAWAGTGNKIVDDLLSDYVRPLEILI